MPWCRRRPSAALAVLVADCAAVALASPEGAFAAVHAGWRGVRDGVIEAAADAMRSLGASRLVERRRALHPSLLLRVLRQATSRRWSTSSGRSFGAGRPRVVPHSTCPPPCAPPSTGPGSKRWAVSTVARDAAVASSRTGRGARTSRQALLVWRAAGPGAGERGSRWPPHVSERLAAIRERIARVAPDPSAVTVVAVTKGFGAEAVSAALAAGLSDVGENYAAELLAKAGRPGPGHPSRLALPGRRPTEQGGPPGAGGQLLAIGLPARGGDRPSPATAPMPPCWSR